MIQVTEAAIARDVRLKKQQNVDKKTRRCSVVALDHIKRFCPTPHVHTYVLVLIIAKAVKK